MNLDAFLNQTGFHQGTFASRFPGSFLLEETGGDGDGLVFYLGAGGPQPLTIGRSAQADLRVQDPNVSSRHLQLLPPAEPGAPWRVVDLESTNGTFLDEAPLKPGRKAPLEDGAQLRLGPRRTFAFLASESLRQRLAARLDEDAAREAPTDSLLDLPEVTPVMGVPIPRPRPGPPPRRPPTGRLRRPPGRPPRPRRAPTGRYRRPLRPRPAPPPSPTAEPASAPSPYGEARPAPAPRPAPPPRPEAPPASAPAAEAGGPSASPPAVGRGDERDLRALLLDARHQRASDLHLVPGAEPVLRVNRALVRRGLPLAAEVIERLVDAIVPAERLEAYRKTGDYDGRYAFDSGGRFRVNVCLGRSGSSISVRLIQDRIPTLDELGIPSEAERLTTYAQGLVLVTGPSGAGKTTTLAALVQLVNAARPDHILTIEDPVEFFLPGARCQVSQRELGTHTASFESALRAALREDPDVIVIGDLRDHTTTAMAVQAAETGHLVLASMHAVSAIKSLDKLLDMFPASEQEATRQVVSESLRGILFQRLVPGVDGRPVPAVELLFNSVAVANLIREGRTSGLLNAMQTGRAHGMRLLDDSLAQLLAAERITRETARAEADSPRRFGGAPAGEAE